MSDGCSSLGARHSSGAIFADPTTDRATGVARPQRYEPIIVTTLRRYVRRGASSALLERLAGGRGGWRVLNQVYDLDGTAELVEVAPGRRPRLALDEGLPELGIAERRIVLEQLAMECVETGAAFPTLHELADYLGCACQSVDNDLRVLRRGQAVDWEIAGDERGHRRVMVSVREESLPGARDSVPPHDHERSGTGCRAPGA